MNISMISGSSSSFLNSPRYCSVKFSRTASGPGIPAKGLSISGNGVAVGVGEGVGVLVVVGEDVDVAVEVAVGVEVVVEVTLGAVVGVEVGFDD